MKPTAALHSGTWSHLLVEAACVLKVFLYYIHFEISHSTAKVVQTPFLYFILALDFYD